MPSIAIAGSIAQRPGRPGHAWAFLSYLIGFQRLGYEVLFLDAMAGDPTPAELRWLERVMGEAGLARDYSVLLPGARSVGLPREEVQRRLPGCSLLLNVNGFLKDEAMLSAAPLRVYLDIDPGFAQIWAAEGLADTFAGHEAFVSVGTNIGGEDCRIPLAGREWIPTLPPVVVDRWPAVAGGEKFTSIGSWRGPFAPLEYQGETYGLRVHEFRRFAGLPKLVDAPFEIALDIDPADAADGEALRQGGWQLVDPLRELADFGSYAAYIQGSLAEIGIAKNLYVDTRSGWFSDRSATYLAAGKPVLAQDTGFANSLPVGRGLLSFSDPEEAVIAAEEVLSDSGAHARAAREIAEEHLACEVVLSRLLQRLGVR
jgi:hypothetical protein